jgi:hypothetical protein
VDCVLRGGEINDQSLIARHVGDLQIGVYVAPSYIGTPQRPCASARAGNTDHRIVDSCPRTGKIDPLVLHGE